MFDDPERSAQDAPTARNLPELDELPVDLRDVHLDLLALGDHTQAAPPVVERLTAYARELTAVAEVPLAPTRSSQALAPAPAPAVPVPATHQKRRTRVGRQPFTALRQLLRDAWRST